jgi:iron complex transport system ATP-binding protein
VSAAPQTQAPALLARGLSFSHTRVPLFRDLTLRLDKGERVALLGRNGSGKTTLLRLMSGALHPSSGEVLVEGEPIFALPPRARARRIGMVPQETSLAFDFTVMEMVLMGRTPHLGPLGLERPADLEAAREAMRLTGTTALAGRPLSQLSGGERQLAVIARALAQRPRVLLLDEPTAHLDIRHRLEIDDLLARLNRSEGMTILATSHDINLAARSCSRMVLLDGGAIAADGPPGAVMRPDLLSAAYGTPLRVVEDPGTGTPLALPGGRSPAADL